jgi:hypothetical protein
MTPAKRNVLIVLGILALGVTTYFLTRDYFIKHPQSGVTAETKKQTVGFNRV